MKRFFEVDQDGILDVDSNKLLTSLKNKLENINIKTKILTKMKVI